MQRSLGDFEKYNSEDLLFIENFQLGSELIEKARLLTHSNEYHLSQFRIYLENAQYYFELAQTYFSMNSNPAKDVKEKNDSIPAIILSCSYNFTEIKLLDRYQLALENFNKARELSSKASVNEVASELQLARNNLEQAAALIPELENSTQPEIQKIIFSIETLKIRFASSKDELYFLDRYLLGIEEFAQAREIIHFKKMTNTTIEFGAPAELDLLPNDFTQDELRALENQFTKAITYFQEGAAQIPKITDSSHEEIKKLQSFIYKMIGSCYINLGRHVDPVHLIDALKNFKKACETHPNQYYYYFDIASAYNCLAEAVKLYPKNIIFLEQLSQSKLMFSPYRLFKKAEEYNELALAMAGKLGEKFPDGIEQKLEIYIDIYTQLDQHITKHHDEKGTLLDAQIKKLAYEQRIILLQKEFNHDPRCSLNARANSSHHSHSHSHHPRNDHHLYTQHLQEILPSTITKKKDEVPKLSNLVISNYFTPLKQSVASTPTSSEEKPLHLSSPT